MCAWRAGTLYERNSYGSCSSDTCYDSVSRFRKPFLSPPPHSCVINSNLQTHATSCFLALAYLLACCLLRLLLCLLGFLLLSYVLVVGVELSCAAIFQPNRRTYYDDDNSFYHPTSLLDRVGTFFYVAYSNTQADSQIFTASKGRRARGRLPQRSREQLKEPP